MSPIRIGMSIRVMGIRTRALALTAAVVLVALALSAGVASADDGHSRDNFHLDKTCTEDLSEPLGYFCTVQHSDFELFPAGTEVHYAATRKANVVRATITIPSGSTTGLCVWSSDVDAICTFKTGTGRLADFYLRVIVTASADQSIWYWDGTYRFNGHHDDD